MMRTVVQHAVALAVGRGAEARGQDLRHLERGLAGSPESGRTTSVAPEATTFAFNSRPQIGRRH
jgi:hypothetical protein